MWMIRPPAKLTYRDIITIIGYIFCFSGIFLSIEIFFSLGWNQYPGGYGRITTSTSRYLLYAYKSSVFFKYSLLLIGIGIPLVVMGHILGWRAKRFYSKDKPLHSKHHH